MLDIVSSQCLDFRALPGRVAADPFGELGRADGMAVRLVRLDHDPECRAHLHPHTAEVVYVVSGSGVAWTSDRQAPIAAGDFVRVPRGMPNATAPRPGSSMTLVCFFPMSEMEDNVEELPLPARISA